ncbi:MAG TPA: hypothetical protein VN419_03075 [Humidesulfovibrio sp.]|uniref:hypothetical protein n=1 Tax=Humidesulfovibrio sp. TaxID=2910988 RepID=UPI002B8E719C|nr:hypothetical protein [Humidesulfovibrio sp.]HWR02980.1 hypothetical protein [Humidesulfovibrio sp.]
MRNLWRALPRLALPAAIGLGLAHLATGFLPKPGATLRPPEELRAMGQAYGEESPVRAIFERNVLQLESPPFAPPGRPLDPPAVPDAAAAALAHPSEAQQQGQANQTGAADTPGAAFAPLEPVLLPKPVGRKAPGVLSGRASVQGLVAQPGASGAGGANGGPSGGLEGVRLVGVIAGGAKPAAMLQVDGAAQTLHPGDLVKGWLVDSVSPGRVILRKGQDTRTLRLPEPAGQPLQTGHAGAKPAQP